MTHCTVCGAVAREGAKFCTSCGARLVDTVAEPVDATATAAQPVVINAPAESSGDRSNPESTWASTVSGNATGEVESVPAEPEAAAAGPAESPEYTASWPGAEDETAETPAGDEPPAQPEAAWSSWSSGASTVTGPAPDSFATDADQDPAPHAVPDTDDGEAAVAADEPAPEMRDPMDASHHGASEWESWAPTASGEATVPTTSSGDVGASVRRLLDDLANRIDRLIDPAPISARGVDADELADQLGRWSSASTDADGLLEVVRAVRTSPRDVDALTRLADRAPDLELLVRHYQAITGSAGDWAKKLRDQQSSANDDA